MEIDLDSYFASEDQTPDSARDSGGRGTSVGGRPSHIDDQTLWDRRNRLIEMLSYDWGKIGRQLECAQVPDDLRAAFEPLQHAAHSYLLAPFTRSTISEATTIDIRRTRLRLQGVLERWWAAKSSFDANNEHLREAEIALAQSSPAPPEVIKRARDIRHVKFEQADSEFASIQTELEVVETLIADQEAYFAQSELLAFIARPKYAYTPRNVAHAMAGLPEIGCWHSFNRCAKEPSMMWPNRHFQTFEFIAKNCNYAGDNSKSLWLGALPDRIKAISDNEELRRYLSDNWRYLHQAIADAQISDAIPAAMPYRIYDEFQEKLAGSKSMTEIVLAETEKIVLS